MPRFEEFKIGDLFFIETGRDVIISQTQVGEIPLISHQHSNNGITKHIKRLENRKLYSYKETLALADRGVFYATTQCQDFHIGTRVKALTFKDGEKSEKIRLYFVTAINKLQIMFEEYLENATNKLPNLKIKLPVNDKMEIDYTFMEKEMFENQNGYLNELKLQNEEMIKNSLIEFGLSDYKLTTEETQALQAYCNDNVEYKNYKLIDLFVSNNGDTDIQKKDIENIGTYVISSGEKDNGIIGKTTVRAKVINSGTITVDMFGNSFYRDFEYKMVTHARVFSLEYKERSLTREEGIYFCSVLKFLKEKYSYSNMASWDKIKNEKIRIPIKNDQTIDYEFINNFIKAEEKILIKELYDNENNNIIFLEQMIKRT